MLNEQEKYNAVMIHLKGLVDSGRLVHHDGLGISRCVTLRELFEIFEEQHPSVVKRLEYFSLIRKQQTLRIENGASPKVLCYGLAEKIPAPKVKALKQTEAEVIDGNCQDCIREFSTPGSAASHAKASGHTVKIKTLLSMTFNPKA